MGSATAQELLPQSDLSNSRSIVIDMESYVFSPSEIIVDAGKPITLVLNNQSFLVPHNFLLDDPNGVRVLEAEISSGESQTHTLTLTEPGIYLFYCDKQLLFFPHPIVKKGWKVVSSFVKVCPFLHLIECS